MYKRLLSLALALAMMLGMTPASAWAAGEPEALPPMEQAASEVFDELAFYSGTNMNTASVYSATWEGTSCKVIVPDSMTGFAICPTLSESWAGAGMEVRYVRYNSTTERNTTLTSGKASSLSSLLVSNNATYGSNNATLTLTVTPAEGDAAVYTIEVVRQAQLASLGVAGRKLNETFASATTRYTVDLPATATEMTLAAIPVTAGAQVSCNGASSMTAALDENGAATVTVAKEGMEPGIYVVTANPVAPFAASVTATPAYASIVLYDEWGNAHAHGIGSVSADDLIGATSYTVSCYGYLTQTGSLSSGARVEVTLTPAAANELPQYSGDWIDFRNSADNMAVTAAATPTNAEEAVLKWGVKYGGGYASSITPPIILNDVTVDGQVRDVLYIAANVSVLMLDKQTGLTLKSGTLASNVGYALNPITYGDGMLFVPIGNGQVQALRADTLESLWVSEAVGGQTLSPITYRNGYLYTGTWGGEQADGVYFCLSATDEDPTAGDETKLCTWKLIHQGGFYWAGAYATDDYVIFGSDDGTKEGSYTANSVLYSVHPTTGEVLDTVTGLTGDIRSTVAYDAESGAVYCTTKGGQFVKVRVNADGSFAEGSLQTLALGGMSTGTPLIYGGVAFLGVAGASQFSASGHLYKLVDIETMTALHTVDAIPGYVQTSALLSTAGVTLEDGVPSGKVYVYLTYNYQPGGIYAIEYDLDSGDCRAYDLFTPPAGMQQYCICSLVCDAEGTIYYKNDSGYLMAVCSNGAYLSGLTASTGKGLEGFAAANLDYELVVPVGTQSVTLSPTAPEGAAVTVNGAAADQPVALANGTASATVVVTRGGDTRTYIVSIREASTNAALGTLLVNESNSYGSAKTLTPAFDAGTLRYVVFGVGSSRSFENVWPEAADPNASVKLYAVSNVTRAGQADGTIPVTAATSGHDRYAVYFADGAKPAVVRIEVTAEDGVTTGSYLLLMTKSAASAISYAETLSLDADTLTLAAAQETATLTATAGSVLGSGTLETLLWSSSNEKVATVSPEGVVTAIGGGTAVITVRGALSSASCAVTCTMNKRITVSAYDYNAVDAALAGASATGVIFEQTVSLAYDATAAQAVRAAAEAAGVTVVVDETYGPYVSAINGLAAGTGGGYSGWCLSYNNDDFANLGLGSLALSDGDTLAFHYSVNADTMTDDVGNGWYGLPIVTSLTLAGRTVTMSKETAYDPNTYAAVTSYYIHGNQGIKTFLSGTGTADDPFVIPVALPTGTSPDSLTATYTASLSAHYRVVTGLDGTRDYSADLPFTLATLGGTQQTHYLVRVTVSSPSGSGAGGGSGSSTMRVSFRLIGASLSDEDVDVGAGTGNAVYQSWIRTRRYTLPVGATVYDLFLAAMEDAGLRSVGAERNYVETIYAPAGYGGYALSEFTNGPRSGWMYTVNGSHPSYGLREWTLEDGDAVIWHYVNDYAYEVEDWFDDPDYPAQGNSSTWVDWSSVADTDPPAPGSTIVLPEGEIPLAGALPFVDVAGHWGLDAIRYAYENGLMEGMSELLFSPDTTLSRAMLVVILHRIEGESAVTAENPFTDVPSGQWYSDAVLWASANGIVEGVGDGLFAPGTDLTREQLATMLYRYAQYKRYDVSVGESTNILSYDDALTISEYAIVPMQWACGAGLIHGRTPSTLAPLGTATRAEAATILMRLLESVKK